jgi:hypothetical protein
MRLLRTANGGFINSEKILRLADERGGDADAWVAILDEGEKVALAGYYSLQGRVERELPDIMLVPASVVSECAATCGTLP